MSGGERLHLSISFSFISITLQRCNWSISYLLFSTTCQFWLPYDNLIIIIICGQTDLILRGVGGGGERVNLINKNEIFSSQTWRAGSMTFSRVRPSVRTAAVQRLNDMLVSFFTNCFVDHLVNAKKYWKLIHLLSMWRSRVVPQVPPFNCCRWRIRSHYAGSIVNGWSVAHAQGRVCFHKGKS